MMTLDEAIKHCEEKGRGCTECAAEHRQLSNWLKELKNFKRKQTQSTWKPSTLQIEALESATENCAYSEYQDCLRGLIGQLKKLREE